MALEVRRVWASPPEIYRKGTTEVLPFNVTIKGQKFLLRSDFPVLLYKNGDVVAGAGGLGYPHTFRFHMCPGREHTFELRFPVGRGGTGVTYPAVNWNQSELLGKHGVLCLDGAYDDEPWPEPPNPAMLPTRNNGTIYFVLVPITASGTWGTQTYGALSGVFDFGIQGTFNEFWCNYYTADIETTAPIGLAEPAERAFEFLWRKSPNVVGDGGQLLEMALPDVGGARYAKWACPMNWFKIPVRSLYKPWAAETPTIEIEAWGPPTTMTMICSLRLVGAYLL